MVMVLVAAALAAWCTVSLVVGVLAGRTIESTERTLGDVDVPLPRREERVPGPVDRTGRSVGP